ncbi:MAG TPA: phage tail protein [Candidatus Limnocylindria bacterium]|nr:phage tail protein [Candidatus Limnocylindria bacterium]
MSGSSRRRFLGTAAGATGVALGAAVWGSQQAAAAVFPPAGAQALPANQRAFVSGRFALDLGSGENKQPAGFLQDMEGGGATSDVVLEKVGADHVQKKHIAGVKYEDITVNVGTGMSKAFYSWISATWSANPQRKDGSIVAADFNLNAMQKREFFNALITEIGIPACDASSKDAAFMTLKFAPEFTRTQKASGKVSGGDFGTKQKMWLPSNFRLEIPSLDTTTVTKIEALTIKQKVVENPTGELRDFQPAPSSVEFPNLVITLADSSSASWRQWFDSFVIKGNNDDAQEKNGRLLFLTPNLQDAFLEIQLFHLGIFRLHDTTWDDDVAGTGNVGRVKAELYCERMLFNWLGGVPIPPPPSPNPTPPPTA